MTTLLILEVKRGSRFPADVPWLFLSGPVCLAATAFSIFEIARGHRWIPIGLLCIVAGAVLWLAMRDNDPIFLTTAIAVAVFVGAAVLLLATNRVTRA